MKLSRNRIKNLLKSDNQSRKNKKRTGTNKSKSYNNRYDLSSTNNIFKKSKKSHTAHKHRKPFNLRKKTIKGGVEYRPIPPTTLPSLNPANNKKKNNKPLPVPVMNPGTHTSQNATVENNKIAFINRVQGNAAEEKPLPDPFKRIPANSDNLQVRKPSPPPPGSTAPPLPPPMAS